MRSARWAPKFSWNGIEYAVVRRVDAAAVEVAVALPPDEAARVFEAAFSHGEVVQSSFQPGGDLREVAIRLGLGSPAEGGSFPRPAIYARATHLVRAGSLRIIPVDRIPRPRPLADAVAANPGAARPFDAPAPPAYSWIELRVVDTADRPIAGARVRVRDPEGAIREARTDAQGVLHLEVPAGQCQVEMPTLDGASWTAAAG